MSINGDSDIKLPTWPSRKASLGLVVEIVWSSVVPVQKNPQNHLKIAMKCWDNEKSWEFHGSATHIPTEFFSSNWCEWNRPQQVTKRQFAPTAMCIPTVQPLRQATHSSDAHCWWRLPDIYQNTKSIIWASAWLASAFSVRKRRIIGDTEGGSKKSEKTDLCGRFNSFQHGWNSKHFGHDVDTVSLQRNSLE